LAIVTPVPVATNVKYSFVLLISFGVNILLTNLNANEFKKLKKKKDLSLDELFVEFEECKNLEDKVKLFSHIQAMIKDCELELFDE
jgi:hypothetical protein